MAFWERRDVQLSIIIPFRAPAGSIRDRNFQWVRRYYSTALPYAEIIQGDSKGDVFSKTAAVNAAVAKSRGRVLAIVDADAYLAADILQDCADRLDSAMSVGHQRWFIPYRRLYRLTEDVSAAVCASDPADPFWLPTPPPTEWVESTAGSMHGRRYGALTVVYPREAFDLVGGMDPRFIGWGGEDVAFARALDTLYGKHKTTDNDIFHIWHPKIGEDFRDRRWPGQTAVQPNGYLATRYGQATGDAPKMRALVDEGAAYARDQLWYRRLAAGIRTWLHPPADD